MLSPSDYAIPPGSLILVTGANGYIATHVIDILLSMGYNVRGTIRSPRPWLNEYFDTKYGSGRLETTIVPALDNPTLWTEKLDGVAGVLHIASDLSWNSDPAAVIPFAKKAAICILEAAAREKSINRFILTSSSSAVIFPVPNQGGIRVDEHTYNETSIKAAWDDTTPKETRAYHVYCASKAEQEKAAWEWIENNNPGFHFNTVIPDASYGRILHPEISGSSFGLLRNMLKGDDLIMRRFPPQWFVNVEDTARLHVIALLHPTVKNERIFAFAAPFNWIDIIQILRKLRPKNKLIPEPPEIEGRDLGEIVRAPRAEGLLREFFGQNGWRGLEESIAEGIVDLE
ncbi:putative aldehyde reductase [Aspergillus crustosus]